MKEQIEKPKLKNDNTNIDRKVEKMVAEWDMVRCHYCKKKISMLSARMISGEYFVCKGH
jgi:hypothetical protein